MNFKSKDIIVIALAIATLIGGGVLDFLIFSGGDADAQNPQSKATDQTLAPLPRTTTTAPAIVQAPATATPTPTATPVPTLDKMKNWENGGGGQEMTDPDSKAASAASVQYVSAWVNRLGYQNANSMSYLDTLLNKGVITQGFYDKAHDGQASPSKTAADKLYVDTSGVSCPMISQAGPILRDGKGVVKCYYAGQWMVQNGGTADASTIDKLELPWIDSSVGHTMSVNVVQEGDAWKVDGTS